MRSTFILVLLLCMTAPIAAMSASDAVAPASPANPAVKAYYFGGADEPQFSDSKDWDNTVSIEIKDVTLGEAVKVLLKNTDIKCIVDPQVVSLKVTAVLKNVKLKSALMEIIKAAGATLKTEDGVLHISPRQPYNSFAAALESQIAGLLEQLGKVRAGNPGDENAGKVLQGTIDLLQKRLDDERKAVPHAPGSPSWYFSLPTAPGKGGVTKVFTIQYINPAEIVPLMYSLGARQVTVVSGGKLVINASEEAMAQAADIIRQVDTEEALPRPVTVKIYATYLVVDRTGKKESLESSTSGTVAEGEPIKLKTFAEPNNDDVAPYLLLDIQLLPEIGAGDQVTLVGAVAMPALAEKPELKMADTPVAVTVKSGSNTVISQGSFDINGGKLEFEVRAEVSVGKERLKTRTKGGGFGGGGGNFIAPGLGGSYKGELDIFGGDTECFDPTQWSIPHGMEEAATQWNGAFDAYGERMNGFAAAMNAAAAQWQRALDAFGASGGFGGLGGDAGGYGGYGQDSHTPDCPSGGGGGGGA